MAAIGIYPASCEALSGVAAFIITGGCFAS